MPLSAPANNLSLRCQCKRTLAAAVRAVPGHRLPVGVTVRPALDCPTQAARIYNISIRVARHG